MVLILIFGEVLGLYGCVTVSSNQIKANITFDRLIVALIMNSRATEATCS